jgi:hypothetical protein
MTDILVQILVLKSIVNGLNHLSMVRDGGKYASESFKKLENIIYWYNYKQYNIILLLF